jgi:glycosyltransferase involved in cell wall biosynthesis
VNDYNNVCTMNKILEYMAFGKAQVMFDTVEGRFSAGDAAVYVGGNDPAAMGRAILDLLDDPARRERMGREGRNRLAVELGWDRSRAALLSAYGMLERS